MKTMPDDMPLKLAGIAAKSITGLPFFLWEDAVQEGAMGELKVIHGRFYEDLTLDKIGKKMKISRERVRQIEEQALNKLKWIMDKENK